MRHTQGKSSRLSFDILAPDISLNYRGLSTVHTKTGTCLSIVCVIIFISLSISIFMSYIDTSKPKVSEELVALKNKPLINFKEDKMYPVLFFKEASNYISMEEAGKYAHIVYRHYVFKIQDTGKEEIEVKELKLVGCKELVDAGETSSIVVESEGTVKNLYYKYGVCVDNRQEDFELGGAEKEVEKTEESVYLEIYPCTLGAECKPASELNQFSYSISNPKTHLRAGNFESPLQTFTEQEDIFTINPYFSVFQKLKVMRSEIYDESGFLSPTKKVKSYVSHFEKHFVYDSRNQSKVSCTLKEVEDYYDCYPYFTQIIFLTNNLNKITREYKGIVEAISEVGGMIDLVFLFFYTIYGYYQNKCLKEEIVHSVYGVENPNKGNYLKSLFCWCSDKKSKVKSSTKSNENDIKKRKVYEYLINSIDKRLDIVLIMKELDCIKVLMDKVMTNSKDRIVYLDKMIDENKKNEPKPTQKITKNNIRQESNVKEKCQTPSDSSLARIDVSPAEEKNDNKNKDKEKIGGEMDYSGYLIYKMELEDEKATQKMDGLLDNLSNFLSTTQQPKSIKNPQKSIMMKEMDESDLKDIQYYDL